jgi:hypothetical protein
MNDSYNIESVEKIQIHQAGSIEECILRFDIKVKGSCMDVCAHLSPDT